MLLCGGGQWEVDRADSVECISASRFEIASVLVRILVLLLLFVLLVLFVFVIVLLVRGGGDLLL